MVVAIETARSCKGGVVVRGSSGRTEAQHAVPRGVFVICFLIFAVACIPVLAAPVLPTIDFYDHISRYFVLSRVSSDPFLAQNYASNWSLLPNIGLDVLGVTLMRDVGPIEGSKTVALLIFAVQYTGVLFFGWSLNKRLCITTALLASMLMYSFIFTWGFANFLLGLGFVFWGGGIWLLVRRRPAISASVGIIVGVLIFLTHGVAFALYGLLLGGLELGFYCARRNLLELVRNGLLLASQAIAPAVLFLSGPTDEAPDGLTNASAAVNRLSEDGLLFDRLVEIAAYRLHTILRVAEGPTWWLDGICLVVVVAALAVLGRTGALKLPRRAWVAVGIGALLIAIVPPAMFGVGYVADRMPLFLAMLMAGSFAFTRPTRPVQQLAICAIAAVAVFRIFGLTWDWHRYGEDLADFRNISSNIGERSVVGFVNVRTGQREDPTQRCEMYGPLLVSLAGHAAPLFAIPTAQPMKLTGQLQWALADLPQHRRFNQDEARVYYNHLLDVLVEQRRFDYVLVCDADALERGDPLTRLPVVAHVGRFTLLSLKG